MHRPAATDDCTKDSASESVMSRALVEWLGRPENYPEPSGLVELRETHISWVFLTGQHAYKLKKPVCFEFLDFRTVQQRRQACRQELHLNRRLAPDVYLDVIPVKRSGERFSWTAPSPAVDWLVKMRRLPDEANMDTMLSDSRLDASHAGSLADRLCRFYRELPPAPVSSTAYHARLQQHVEANDAELTNAAHGLPILQVRMAHQAQRRLLKVWPDALAQRVREGRIVDGHGDLRPEHVYFLPQPTIIDCIEFNEEFRQLDVLDELSFLAMECAFRGAEQVGHDIIQRYCQATGDHPDPQLLPFYACYRACVRAKVAILRAAQEEMQQEQLRQMAIRYLELADAYAKQFARPMLIVMIGMSGTGKSVVAQELAAALQLDVLATDTVRRQQFGKSAGEQSYGEGRYSRANRDAVYDLLLQQAESALSDGFSVVLDGTFLQRAHRTAAAACARRQDAGVLFVHCTCPPELAERRIQKRRQAGGTLSEATTEVLRRQDETADWEFDDLPVCSVDTSAGSHDILQAIFTSWRRQFDIRVANKRETES